VRRRRVFVRVRPAEDPSRTLVTIGGLAKTSDPGLGAVLAGLRDDVSTGR
jgi:cytochrome c biogenesis protein